MASVSVLSQRQFPGRRQLLRDPSGDPKFNKTKFSGNPGSSKTMHIARGRVPTPPGVHPHHRKTTKRAHRIR